VTRVGSLCSGVGGLDLAVEDVFPGAELAWYAQYEPPNRKTGKPDRNQYAAKIMAHHWPGVPNLGDIATIDYSGIEPVDLLMAGFPCTDVSLAGKREGLMPGTRSGVWAHVARAIAFLRPKLVFIENVRSLTSARAHCDLEHCPGCMGEPDDRYRPLRALGAVLGDLADLGLDAEWLCLPARDVGAPHLRWRIFILAWPIAEDPDRAIGGQRRISAPGQEDCGRPWGDTRGPGGEGPDVSDAAGVGRGEGRPEPARLLRGPDSAFGGGPASADADEDGRERRAQQDRESLEPILEASRRNDAVRRDGAPARFPWELTDYGPAVERWERITGRHAPRPRNERERLSPRFVEWMMGLPDGWVTGVPGIPNSAQLHALGNGVVPRQAAAALRTLMAAYEQRGDDGMADKTFGAWLLGQTERQDTTGTLARAWKALREANGHTRVRTAKGIRELMMGALGDDWAALRGDETFAEAEREWKGGETGSYRLTEQGAQAAAALAPYAGRQISESEHGSQPPAPGSEITQHAVLVIEGVELLLEAGKRYLLKPGLPVIREDDGPVHAPDTAEAVLDAAVRPDGGIDWAALYEMADHTVPEGVYAGQGEE